MSAEGGFHHLNVQSHSDARLDRIEHALSTYGCLTRDQLIERLCPGSRGAAQLRATLAEAVRKGVIRQFNDVYAMAPRAEGTPPPHGGDTHGED